jgi:hypothetical protein
MTTGQSCIRLIALTALGLMAASLLVADTLPTTRPSAHSSTMPHRVTTRPFGPGGVLLDAKGLEDNLEAELADADDFDLESLSYFDSLPSARRVLDTKDALLWSALLAEGDKPLVQLLGFYGLTRGNPAIAKEAAVTLLCAATRPGGSFLGPVLTELGEDWTKEDLAILDRHAEAMGASTMTFALVTLAIPHQALRDWITTQDSKALLNVRMYAQAMDVVFDGKLAEDKEWLNRLKKLRQTPGLARYVYLMNVPKNEAGDLDLVTHALCGEELDDIEFQFLANHYLLRLDLSQIRAKLPENRKAMLERLERKHRNELNTM